MDALVVSEDAAFIVEAQGLLRAGGARAVGSLGACDASWLPDQIGVAVIDAPVGGSFHDGRASVEDDPTGPTSAGGYAELLADRHPEALVLLRCVEEGSVGYTGGIPTVATRSEALALLAELIVVNSAKPPGARRP